MINKEITEKLIECSDACERIRIALNWFKKQLKYNNLNNF